MSQRTFEYNIQDRNWLTSTHVEGRSDIRHNSQMPPYPVPSRFSDWSSLGSPHARTSPHSASDIQVEQNENVQNQLSVPSEVGTRPERVRTSFPEEVYVSLQMGQQREDQRVAAILEPASLTREVRTQRNDVESNVESEVNIPPPPVFGSVRSPLNVNDLILSRNIHQEPITILAPSRNSHIGNQDINIREISSIPPGERVISNLDG